MAHESRCRTPRRWLHRKVRSIQCVDQKTLGHSVPSELLLEAQAAKSSDSGGLFSLGGSLFLVMTLYSQEKAQDEEGLAFSKDFHQVICSLLFSRCVIGPIEAIPSDSDTALNSLPTSTMHWAPFPCVTPLHTLLA